MTYCLRCGIPHSHQPCRREDNRSMEPPKTGMPSFDDGNQSISGDSVGQSADLRTRITAILAKHYPQTAGQDEPTDWCQCGMPRDHVADAVIRELQLTVLGDGIVVGVIHA